MRKKRGGCNGGNKKTKIIENEIDKKKPDVPTKTKIQPPPPPSDPGETGGF